MGAPRSRWASLRLHAWLIGAFTLALAWGVSALLHRFGLRSLALRYLLALSVWYAGYLLVLRWWAEQLLRDQNFHVADAGDAMELAADVANVAGWPEAATSAGSAADATGIADAASSALDAAGSLDEGAVVVVPVLAIFAVLAALLVGAGAVALLFFGWDVLLAVAVELAFAGVAARTTMGLERSGWLGAALCLTARPMLLVLLCAALLGGAIDHWLPQADTLAQAVRQLRSALLQP